MPVNGHCHCCWCLVASKDDTILAVHCQKQLCLFPLFICFIWLSLLTSSSVLSISTAHVHVWDAMRRDEATKLKQCVSSGGSEWHKFTSQWVTMSRCVFSRFPKLFHLVSISVIMTGTEASKQANHRPSENCRLCVIPSLHTGKHCTILINSVRSASSLLHFFSL